MGVLGLEDKMSSTIKAALGLTRNLRTEVSGLSRELQNLGRQKTTVRVAVGGTAAAELRQMQQTLTKLGQTSKSLNFGGSTRSRAAATLMDPSQAGKLINLDDHRARLQEARLRRAEALATQAETRVGQQKTQSQTKLLKQQETARLSFERRAQAFLGRQSAKETLGAWATINGKPDSLTELVNGAKAAREEFAKSLVISPPSATQNRVMSLLGKYKEPLTNAAKTFGSALQTGVTKAGSLLKSVGSTALKVITAPFKLLGSLPGMIGLAGAGYGLFGLVKGAVDFSASMEQAQIGFTTMLGDAQKASAFVQKLFQFAAVTPFQFPQVQSAAQTWLAMGFKPDEIIPDLTAVGNAISAIGIKDQGTLDRIVMSIGQIRTTGKVSARELRELALAGIPVYDILAEKLHLSQQQIMSIGNAGISSQKALDALFAGFNERYAGGMDKQSRSWNGLWSTIKDNLQMTLGFLGNGIRDKLQPSLAAVTDWFIKSPEKVKEWQGKLYTLGYMASNDLVKAFDSAMRRVQSLLNNPAFASADLFGKISIAWDTLIGQPLSDWWNGPGQQQVSKVAGAMGSFLGGTIAGAVRAAFGLGNDAGMIDAGTVAGKAFVDGFVTQLESVPWGQVIGKAITGSLRLTGQGAAGVGQEVLHMAPGGKPVDWGNMVTGGVETAAGGWLLNKLSGGLLGKGVSWAGGKVWSKLFPKAGAAGATAAEAAAAEATAAGGAAATTNASSWLTKATPWIAKAAPWLGRVGDVTAPLMALWDYRKSQLAAEANATHIQNLTDTSKIEAHMGMPGSHPLPPLSSKTETTQKKDININLSITRADTPDDESLARKVSDHVFGRLLPILEQ